MSQANAKAKRKITDKQRLNFLRMNKKTLIMNIGGKEWSMSCYCGFYKTPRQAIDAAIRSEGSK